MSLTLVLLIAVAGLSLLVFAVFADFAWRLGSFVVLTLIGFAWLLWWQRVEQGPLGGLLVLMAIGTAVTVILVILGGWLRKELMRRTGETGPDLESSPHD